MQDTVKRIIDIITSNFPNGIRDDFIDTNKVLRIYSANGANRPVSRDLIVTVINENGIGYNGRFYFISESDSRKILRLIDEIFILYSMAYYESVYEKHCKFFSSMHIFSPDVLKKFLRRNDDKNFYFDEFCSVYMSTRLDYEVAKIFMEETKALSIDDLKERLPYVPAEKILSVLSDTKKFLSTNESKYIPLSKIQFDTDEIGTAKQQIISAININGYAALEDYNLSSNLALNPELNEKVLCNVIYEKFFASDFIKRGKKFFNKNAVVHDNRDKAVNRIREFVAEYDELSLEKLLAAAKDFDINPSAALAAAHEKMIRVKENLFVKAELISFDVAGIDASLSFFVQGKIISLRSVTSFTGFPPVAGYSWNLFLLESFLRKYSQRYVYDAPAANSANIGAIYPKSMNFSDYLDVQASVIVQENILLEKSGVEEFLIEQGFRSRRIAKVTRQIIARAQEILKR